MKYKQTTPRGIYFILINHKYYTLVISPVLRMSINIRGDYVKVKRKSEEQRPCGSERVFSQRPKNLGNGWNRIHQQFKMRYDCRCHQLMYLEYAPCSTCSGGSTRSFRLGDGCDNLVDTEDNDHPFHLFCVENICEIKGT